MVSNTATIHNKYGIHCRPSSAIAQAASTFDGTVTAEKAGHPPANCSSVLGLIGLELTYGTEVTIKVNGPDEVQFLEIIMELFEKDFEFER